MGVKNYHEHIIRDPEVCGGQATFKGTRVTLRTVLASLAQGDSPQEILSDFPTLKSLNLKTSRLRLCLLLLPRKRICRSRASSYIP